MSALPILYVEDEETDIMLLRHVLEKGGFTNPLHAVKDGKLAKDYLSGLPPYDDRSCYPLPALVLLDLNLPYWSGFEVLEWLRQQPQLRRLPVVIFTSSNRPDDVARAYEACANAYLVKPNSLTDLATMMGAVWDFWLVHNRLPDVLGTPAPVAPNSPPQPA